MTRSTVDNIRRVRYGTLLLLLLTAIPALAASRRHAVSPDRCTEILSPPSLQFPAAGGHASVAVTMKGGCAISPVVSGSWITAAPAAGAVSVDIAANPSSQSRTGYIHVRSSIIVVTQDATTNLLQNGTFDTTIDPWSSARSNNGSAQWANGTAAITSGTGQGVGQLDQCVNIQPSTPYEAGAKAFIASGQPSGQVSLGFFEYWVPNCSPIGAYHAYRIFPAGGPIGIWFDITTSTFPWTSDPNAKSVLIAIGAGSYVGPFTASFDDVYLRVKQ
jgi:hypothetical protein